MVDGYLFYWFCWIFWILVTFFMKKTKYRTFLAYWILVTIISSPHYIHLGFFIISLTVLILFIGSIIIFSKQTKIVFHLFLAFLVSITYSALLFWEKVSPIWLILPRVLLFSMIIGYLVSILSPHLRSRIAICIFGMISGEMIFSFVLASYGLQDEIGEGVFLDTLLFTLLLLTILDILHRGRIKLSEYNSKLQTKLEVAK